jgi:hypothetical protein
MAAFQPQYQIRPSVTNANFATNFVKVDVASQVSVQAVVTAAGSPSSAIIEYTTSPFAEIDAGSAVWFSNLSTNSATTHGAMPVGPVTGVRLNVAASGGTWTLNVLQVLDANKVN